MHSDGVHIGVSQHNISSSDFMRPVADLVAMSIARDDFYLLQTEAAGRAQRS
jgi:hypothetical protein